MRRLPSNPFPTVPALALIGALVATGCAQLPPPPEAGASDQRVTRLKSDPPGIVLFRGWGAAAADRPVEASPPSTATPVSPPVPAATVPPAGAATVTPSAATPTAAPAAARSTATPAQASAAAPSPPAPAGAPPVAGGDSPLTRLLRALPPPTGQPVQDLRQLNAPGLGIAVPTAASRASEAKR